MQCAHKHKHMRKHTRVEAVTGATAKSRVAALNVKGESNGALAWPSLNRGRAIDLQPYTYTYMCCGSHLVLSTRLMVVIFTV